MSTDPLESIGVDAAGLRFGIVAARFNRRYVDALLDKVLRTLDEEGAAEADIETLRTPGAFETPYVAGMLAASGEFDAIIVLAVVVAGDTNHHEVLADSTAEALLRIARESETPVINGIITVNTEQQAEARCMGALNRGREFALAAIEMADLKTQLVRRLDDIFSALEKQKAEDETWDAFFEDIDDDDEEEEPWKS